MAFSTNRPTADPIVKTADMLPDVLQPVNVQLAAMVEHLKELTAAAQQKNAADEQQTKAIQSQGKSILAMAAQVKAGVTAAMVTAAGAVSSMVSQVNQLVGQFVGKFRPDIMQRFTVAVNDLIGAIGETLVPIMQAVVPLFRWLGDLMNGIGRNLRGLVGQGMQSLADVFSQFGRIIERLVGVAVGEGKPMFEKMIQLFDGLAKIALQMANAIEPVLKAIMQLQAAVGGALLDVLNQVLAALKPVFDAVSDIFKSIAEPIKALAVLLGPLVKIALFPLIVGVQLLSTALTPLLKIVAGLFEAFGPLIQSLAQLLASILKPIAQVVQLLVNVFGDLLKPVGELIGMLVKGLVGAIKFVVDSVVGFINGIRKFFGQEEIKTMEADVSGNSLGKGVSQVNFGSTEDMWKKTVQATFGMARNDPIRDVADLTREQNAILKQMPKNIAEAITPMLQLQKQLGWTGQAAEDPREVARRFADGVRGMFRGTEIRGG